MVRRILMAAVAVSVVVTLASGVAEAAPKRSIPTGTQLAGKPGAVILGYNGYWLDVLWWWKHGRRYGIKL